MEKENKPTKPKLLWISDSPNTRNSLGRITREICPLLKKTYDIKVFGIGNNNYQNLGYEIIDSFDVETGIMGLQKVVTLVNTWCPDIIIILNEPVIIAQYASVIKKHINTNLELPKMIGYFYIDCEHIRDDLIDLLNENLSAGIVMSEFAKDQLIKGFTKPLIISPLGFNHSEFKIIDTKEAKYILGIDSNTFVFFCGISNQPNKRLDIIIRSYVNFLTVNKNKKVLLLLNCCVDDIGLDIPKLFKTLCDKEGIANWDNYIKLTSQWGAKPNFNDEDMSIFYSASDVGLCSSMGESWGLINFEHGGFGKPQIIPAFSTINEVLREGVIRIIPNDFFVYPTHNLGQGKIINHSHLTQAMDIYYNDEKLRIMDGFNIKKNVLQYSWLFTINKILELLNYLARK
jgi:hypothetical protein